VFWVTIGSNTNLHLTLINLFSVVGSMVLCDVLTSLVMTVSEEHLTHPKGMEGDLVNYMLKNYLRRSSTLSSYKYIRLKVGWIMHLNFPFL
jgi:hypothetical protein